MWVLVNTLVGVAHPQVQKVCKLNSSFSCLLLACPYSNLQVFVTTVIFRHALEGVICDPNRVGARYFHIVTFLRRLQFPLGFGVIADNLLMLDVAEEILILFETVPNQKRSQRWAVG